MTDNVVFCCSGGVFILTRAEAVQAERAAHDLAHLPGIPSDADPRAVFLDALTWVCTEAGYIPDGVRVFGRSLLHN